MLKTIILTGLAAFGAAVLAICALVGLVAAWQVLTRPEGATWQLQRETATDVYVLDYGLTADDCGERAQEKRGRAPGELICAEMN